jgi:hypothetical protein
VVYYSNAYQGTQKHRQSYDLRRDIFDRSITTAHLELPDCCLKIRVGISKQVPLPALPKSVFASFSCFCEVASIVLASIKVFIQGRRLAVYFRCYYSAFFPCSFIVYTLMSKFPS